MEVILNTDKAHTYTLNFNNGYGLELLQVFDQAYLGSGANPTVRNIASEAFKKLVRINSGELDVNEPNCKTNFALNILHLAMKLNGKHWYDIAEIWFTPDMTNSIGIDLSLRTVMKETALD